MEIEMKTIVALDTFDDMREGMKREYPDGQADTLIKMGVAKLAPPIDNKMAPQGENKANPTAAAGPAAPSSASPAARVSPQPTSKPSGAGGSRTTRAPRAAKPSGRAKKGG